MIERQKSVLLLVLLLLLSACASTEPVPEDQFYRLLEPTGMTRTDTPAIKGTLKVEPIKSFGIYRERPILFTHSDQPEILRQHHYHHWIDTPTRLIRDQLVDYLRASGVAQTVAGAHLGLSGDVRLRLELKHFERIIHPSGEVSVKVQLDAVITNRANRPLKIASYLSEPQAADSSIAASVAAVNLALSGIYHQLASDLLTL